MEEFPESVPLPPQAPRKQRSPKVNKKVAPPTQPKARPPSPRATRVTLTLRAVHQINGVTYGPGAVTVGPGLGATLRRADEEAVAHDQKFFAQPEQARIVGPARDGRGFRDRPVQVDYFEDAMASAGGVDTRGLSPQGQWTEVSPGVARLAPESLD